jgi:hypothetical protein
MRLERRQALIRDLRRLEAEIPELIAHIEAGNEVKTQEALALLTKGSSGRFDFLMNRLTDHVVDEATMISTATNTPFIATSATAHKSRRYSDSLLFSYR